MIVRTAIKSDIPALAELYLKCKDLPTKHNHTNFVFLRSSLKRALQRNQENSSPQAIVNNDNTIYFSAQRFHFSVDKPKSSVDAV